VRGWQVAYRGKMPDDYLKNLDTDERTTMWLHRLDKGIELPDRVLVIEHPADGRVVGFCFVGLCQDADLAIAGIGQVSAVYVEPGSWGEGLGRVLFGSGVDHLRDSGFSEAVLWVLDTNDQARRFYEIAGWEADGAAKVDESWGFPVNEVRYRITL
jgi:GNAT superfamily N-acetyltransferase